jgi:hypothetical protein
MASRKRDQKTDANQHARDNGEELPWAVVYYLTPEPITETLRGLFDRRAEAKEIGWPVSHVRSHHRSGTMVDGHGRLDAAALLLPRDHRTDLRR